MVYSWVSRKPARLSMAGKKFSRALNASFLIDRGALILERPVSPDFLPPTSRAAAPPYLWRKEIPPGLGALSHGRSCMSSVSPSLFLMAFPFSCVSHICIIDRITWWKRWLLKSRFLGPLPKPTKSESWGVRYGNKDPASAVDQAVCKVMPYWVIHWS